MNPRSEAIRSSGGSYCEMMATIYVGDQLARIADALEIPEVLVRPADPDGSKAILGPEMWDVIVGRIDPERVTRIEILGGPPVDPGCREVRIVIRD